MLETVKVPPRPKPLWRVTTGPFVNDEARGSTKGEARAAIKRKYGLPRLPAGTELTRVEGSS